MLRISFPQNQEHAAEARRRGRPALPLPSEAERDTCARAMDRFEAYLSRLEPIRMTLEEMLKARREGLT